VDQIHLVPTFSEVGGDLEMGPNGGYASDWHVIEWVFTSLLLSARVCVCVCVCVVVSLEGRFEDDDLQQILDDIKTQRSFQY